MPGDRSPWREAGKVRVIREGFESEEEREVRGGKNRGREE